MCLYFCYCVYYYKRMLQSSSSSRIVAEKKDENQIKKNSIRLAALSNWLADPQEKWVAAKNNLKLYRKRKKKNSKLTIPNRNFFYFTILWHFIHPLSCIYLWGTTCTKQFFLYHILGRFVLYLILLFRKYRMLVHLECKYEYSHMMRTKNFITSKIKVGYTKSHISLYPPTHVTYLSVCCLFLYVYLHVIIK